MSLRDWTDLLLGHGWRDLHNSARVVVLLGGGGIALLVLVFVAGRCSAGGG